MGNSFHNSAFAARSFLGVEKSEELRPSADRGASPAPTSDSQRLSHASGRSEEEASSSGRRRTTARFNSFNTAAAAIPRQSQRGGTSPAPSAESQRLSLASSRSGEEVNIPAQAESTPAVLFTVVEAVQEASSSAKQRPAAARLKAFTSLGLSSRSPRGRMVNEQGHPREERGASPAPTAHSPRPSHASSRSGDESTGDAKQRPAASRLNSFHNAGVISRLSRK